MKLHVPLLSQYAERDKSLAAEWYIVLALSAKTNGKHSGVPPCILGLQYTQSLHI
jgi:hypothetical protein